MLSAQSLQCVLPPLRFSTPGFQMGTKRKTSRVMPSGRPVKKGLGRGWLPQRLEAVRQGSFECLRSETDHHQMQGSES